MCVGAILVLHKVSPCLIYVPCPCNSASPPGSLGNEEVGVVDPEADGVALTADVAVSKRLKRRQVE